MLEFLCFDRNDSVITLASNYKYSVTGIKNLVLLLQQRSTKILWALKKLDSAEVLPSLMQYENVLLFKIRAKVFDCLCCFINCFLQVFIVSLAIM